MSRHLKRRLLREAVASNVDAIEGRPRRRAAPEAPSRFSIPQLAAMGLVPLLLLPAALYLLRSRPAAEAGTAQAAGTPAVAGAGSEEDPLSQLTFLAPRPIDPRVFPLEVRRIVIDPGHGGEDYGTIGSGLAEKDLTLDIAHKLREMLQKDSYEVHLTRDDDRLLSLRERAQVAKQMQADLFLSIHINWLATRQVRGIETYYLGPTDDPELSEVARRENRRSGYTLREMRPILDSIYTDVLQDQSRRFASRVQRSLFASLLRVNPELKNRGVKTAPFVVLVSTETPAILAEVSCLSNEEEAELLSRPLYREHIAEALARGIRGYADDVNQKEES